MLAAFEKKKMCYRKPPKIRRTDGLQRRRMNIKIIITKAGSSQQQRIMIHKNNVNEQTIGGPPPPFYSPLDQQNKLCDREASTQQK